MRNIFVLIGGILIGFLLLGFLFSFNKVFQGMLDIKQVSNKAIITGQLDLNGFPEEGETLSIKARPFGGTQFDTIVENIATVDGAAWSWDGAIPDQSYEIKAVLVKDGSPIAESETLLVTAPATDEKLRINIPKQLAATNYVVISGSFAINGYLSPGSTLSLAAEKENGDSGKITILDNVSASDRLSWSWIQAEKGVTYKLQGYLYSNGQEVGKSNELTVTAPAANEVLSINISPKPPAPVASPVPQKVGISGKIDLNGSAPANSRIVIYQRNKTEDQYTTVVDNIKPVDGVSWSWPNAMLGTQYDLLGVLKVKQQGGGDLDYAYSQNLQVTAPGHDEVLTINTAISLSPPTSLPAIQCNDKVNNQYNVTISYQNISDAKQYWLQVGTKDDLSDVFNQRVAPTSDSPQTQKMKVDEAKWYYAQYAYSFCADCGDLVHFSSFSHSQSFICQ